MSELDKLDLNWIDSSNEDQRELFLNALNSYLLFKKDSLDKCNLLIKENPDLKTNLLKDDEKTKLMCLSGVKQYPMRVKCATLSWHTLVTAIDKDNVEVNTERTN